MEGVSSTVKSLVKRARGGDALVLGAAAVAAAGATYMLTYFFLAPGDSASSETAHQKAFPSSSSSSSSTAVVASTAGGSSQARRVRLGDVEATAAIMAKANRLNPFLIAAGKKDFNDDQREAALRWTFSVLLRSIVPTSSGSVSLRTDDAAAIWFPPEASLSGGALLWSGAWQFMWRYSGWDRRGRFSGYSDVITSYRKRFMDAKKPFFYLLTYGVVESGDAAPAAAAADAAAAEKRRLESLRGVVAPITARADACDMPCYVEVTTIGDAKLFEQLGFAPIIPDSERQGTFSYFDVIFTCMRREPKKAAATGAAPAASVTVRV